MQCLRRTGVGADDHIGPRDAVVCVPYRHLTEARCPEAFPVQGKVVPQEPDEVSISFFLIGE